MKSYPSAPSTYRGKIPLRATDLPAPLPNRHPIASGVYVLSQSKNRDRLHAQMARWAADDGAGDGAGDHGDAEWSLLLGKMHPFGPFAPYYLGLKQSSTGPACDAGSSGGSGGSGGNCKYISGHDDGVRAAMAGWAAERVKQGQAFELPTGEDIGDMLYMAELYSMQYDALLRGTRGEDLGMYAGTTVMSTAKTGFNLTAGTARWRGLATFYASRAASVFLRLAETAPLWPWAAPHYGRRALTWPHNTTIKGQGACASPPPRGDHSGCELGVKEAFFNRMWLYPDGVFSYASSSYQGSFSSLAYAWDKIYSAPGVLSAKETTAVELGLWEDFLWQVHFTAPLRVLSFHNTSIPLHNHHAVLCPTRATRSTRPPTRVRSHAAFAHSLRSLSPPPRPLLRSLAPFTDLEAGRDRCEQRRHLPAPQVLRHRPRPRRPGADEVGHRQHRLHGPGSVHHRRGLLRVVRLCETGV